MITKLDKIDYVILENLQNEGRITNVDLSRRAGISAPPCLRRIRNLEELHVVEGYHAVLNAQILGYNIVVYAEVTLTGQNDLDLRQFEEQAEKWPMVRECYMITGESDFLLKIVAKDFDHYQNFLSTELTSMPKVAQVKTKMVVRASKRLPGIPVKIHNEK